MFKVRNLILWDSDSGYWGDQGDGVIASLAMQNVTMGDTSGAYDDNNGESADGTVSGRTSGLLTPIALGSLLAWRRRRSSDDLSSIPVEAHRGASSPPDRDSQLPLCQLHHRTAAVVRPVDAHPPHGDAIRVGRA
jgi:MYXO-CTERM domain-containing protein